ncbi:hypothetical protein SAMN05421813_10877 [Daejeonella rubra]|uniref:Uncharacterized protein n=1 Tax=Daejeonella rubra TaxID=990371 RepID=A0A1G9RM66_9SPHI|nr:hypothetical protein [Daejeonella rubra]SDM24356.1 hypothetical protein SAMN05421813_10877 [Daejeonella rubra]
MKRLQNIFLILCLFLVSCSSSDPIVCEDRACTMEFRMVTVKFIDDSGNAQIVKDYSTVNKRTGRSMTPNTDMVVQGLYVVASDADLKELSEKGDIVLVSATNPKNNTKIQAEFVIGGGLCICHVSKISGPETIKI